MLFSLVRPTHAQDAVSDLLGRVNALRIGLGLSAYSLNSQLSVAAQNQAAWMAATGNVSHIQADGSNPRSRAQAAGYASSWVSENIYVGTIASANDAWVFWLNSPVHYAGMTSPNYAEIGIGTSNGSGGKAFVLVFGNQNTPRFDSGGASRGNDGTGTGNNSAESASAPSFVVGWDASGNIMHEIQPGDTLGDIALIYGYTWDDIPRMLELNGMNWDNARVLPLGAVFLVPPKAGTYTPSPNAPIATESAPFTTTPDSSIALETNANPELQATPSPTEAQALALLVSPESIALELTAILPSPNPSETATPEGLIAPEVFSMAQLPSPSPTLSPMPPSPTAIAMIISTLPPANPLAQDALIEETTASPTTGLPAWLIGVILIQIGILAYASIEFIRRLRR